MPHEPPLEAMLQSCAGKVVERIELHGSNDVFVLFDDNTCLNVGADETYGVYVKWYLTQVEH